MLISGCRILYTLFAINQYTLEVYNLAKFKILPAIVLWTMLSFICIYISKVRFEIYSHLKLRYISINMALL